MRSRSPKTPHQLKSNSMSVTTVLILVAIVFSAFFSGMEIAFLSASRLRFEIDRQKNEFVAPILDTYYSHPDRYISTILVGNNIALVVYGILFSELIEPYLAPIGEGALIVLAQTLLSTLVILVAGEFVPKILFKGMPNFWMNTLSVPLFLFYIILYPISMFMSGLSKSIMRLCGVKIKSEGSAMLGRVDLDYFLQESSESSGTDDKIDKEVQIFQNALDFSKVKLRECMVPRTEIEAVAYDDDIDELTRVFCESGRSKVMVYKESIDNIIGYIHTIEMFKRPQKWQERIILAPIVPETMAANRLMNMMLLKKKSMAVVVDEFGGTSGIVTLEDIVEEIFGEIEDEHDTQDYIDKKLSEHEYLLSGRLEIDTLNEKYDWRLPVRDDYQTLAGLILYTYQGIPAEGEEINVSGYALKVVKASQNRLELIRLTVT